MKTFILSAALALSSIIHGQAADWTAGFASAKITPEKPIPLVGYASRTNAFTGVDQDVYAKALALRDDAGKTGLLITIDICILPASVAEPVCERISERTGLKRQEILLSVSHTHSGPSVALSVTPRAGVPPAVTNHIVEYTRGLQDKLVDLAVEAVSQLQPAKLSWGSGIANFVMNRREMTTNGVILGVNPRGYVDRTVPVLRIDSPAGELRGIIFGYACHGTTVPSDSLIVNGDFPGYAQVLLEKRFPKAQAMFIAGLAGSANPYPRTGLDLAKKHGAELAEEVARVLGGKLRPVSTGLKCVFATAALPLQALSREEVEQAARSGKSWERGAAREMLEKLERNESLPTAHSAPISAWQLGPELTLVALSGEVVGEYISLLERALGPMNLWLAAYCHSVAGYIPVRQTLEDGGYECRGLYDGVGFFAPGTEQALVNAVADLAEKAGRPRR